MPESANPQDLPSLVPVEVTPAVAKTASDFGFTPEVMANPKQMVALMEKQAQQQMQQAWARIQEATPNAAFMDQYVFKRIERSHQKLELVQSLAKMLEAPEAITPGKMAWETLKASAEQVPVGMATVVAGLATGGKGLLWGRDQDSLLMDISKATWDRRAQHEQVMQDLAERNMATGGSRVAQVLEGILGQGPEIFATGIGASAIAGRLASKVAGSALGATVGEAAAAASREGSVLRNMRLAARLSRGAGAEREVSIAHKLSAALQGGMEGGRMLADRLHQNYLDGNERFTSADAYAALAVGALVHSTELLGGLTGEMRMLTKQGTPASRAWREFAKDLAIQPAQEAVQEGGQQIIGDIADGKPIQWDEAGWAAFGGALGGGLFTIKSFAHAVTAHLPSDQKRQAIAQLDQMRRATEATKVARDANLTGQMVDTARLFQKESGLTTLDEIRASLVGVTGANVDIHFTTDDMAEIAKTANKTPDEMIKEMRAVENGGTVTVKMGDAVAYMTLADDAVAVKMMERQRTEPDQMSLAEVQEMIKGTKKEVKDAAEQMDKLPDGTADDTEELEAAIAAEIKAAGESASAKAISKKVSQASAAITAALYRTAAVQWNAHSAAKGKEVRVTPKQLWEKSKASFAAEGAGPLAQPAFHGTGNTMPYDRFDYNKVGGAGGEGAQVYGWGLYFSGDKEQVALSYRNWLSKRNQKIIDNLADSVESIAERVGLDDLDSFSFVEEVVKNGQAGQLIKALEGNDYATMADLLNDGFADISASDLADAFPASDPMLSPEAAKQLRGRIYTVDLPEDNELLKWDAPLSAQSDTVKEKLASIPKEVWADLDAILEERNQNPISDFSNDYTGEQLYKLLKKADSIPLDGDNEAKAASDFLRGLGIPGLTYIGEFKKTGGKGARNYVIFDDSRIQIKGMEQPGQEAARGGYDPTTKLIALGGKADASTVVHEVMHHWLETMRGWAQDPEAPQVFRDNLTDIGAWAIKNVEQVVKHYNAGRGKDTPAVTLEQVQAAAKDMLNLDWTTLGGKAVHEGLTGAWEEYMAKGKAPSLRLAVVFESFFKWFRDIYSTILRGGVQVNNSTGTPLMTEDARRLFDRMLAAHDEVLTPRFEVLDPNKLGLDEESTKKYQEAITLAAAKARTEILDRMLSKLREAEAMTRKEAEAEADKALKEIPVHHAQMVIGDSKLNRAEVSALLAGDPKTLERMEKAGMLSDDGISPIKIAEQTQYDPQTDLSKMLTDLVSNPSLENARRDLVDSKVGPQTTDEEMRKNAMEDAENRLAITAAEYEAAQAFAVRIQNEKVKQGADAQMAASPDVTSNKSDNPRDIIKRSKAEILALRYAVRDFIRGLEVSDIRPDKYRRSAEAARRRREQFLISKNVEGIRKTTREIMISEAMYAEAMRAKAEADLTRAKVARFMTQDTTDAMSKSGVVGIYDVDTGEFKPMTTYAEAKAAMDRLDFKRYRITTSEDLAQMHLGMRDLFTKFPSFDKLRKDLAANPGNYTPAMTALINASKRPDTWTISDWKTIESQIGYMLFAAKSRPKQEQETQQIVEAALNEVRAAKAEQPAPPQPSRFRLVSLSKMLWESNMTLETLLFVRNIKDGVLKRLLIDDARVAEMKEQTLHQEALDMRNAALHKLDPSLKNVMSQKVSHDGVMLTRFEQLTQLMMMGSPSGRQRAIEDMKIRYMREAGVSAAEAEIKATQYFANLTSRVSAQEVEIIKAYWQANEHIWGFQVAAAKEAGRPAPENLELQPFSVMVNGEEVKLDGGYAAIPYEVSNGSMNLMDESGKLTNAIDTGTMQPRMAAIKGRALLLGFDKQDESLRNHVRVAAMLPYATRVGAVLRNQQFREAITNRYGSDFLTTINDAVRFNMDGVQAKVWYDKFIRFGRVNVMNSIYMFNLLSAVKQPFGVLTAAGHKNAGVRATVTAMRRVTMSPGEMFDFATEHSAFMHNRWYNQDADLAPTEESIGGPSKWQRIQKTGLQPMRLGQFYADLVTWHAAYATALDAGKADHDARKVADKTVLETQGSAYRTDQAIVNRTQFGNLLTFAGKWMIANSNTIYRMAHDLRIDPRNPENTKRLLKYVAMSIVLGGIAQAGVGALLQPEDDKAKQRTFGDYQSRVLQDILSSPHWVVRNTVPALWNYFEGKQAAYRDAFGASTSMINMLGAPLTQAGKLSRGEDTTIEEVIGSAVKAGGLFTGIPATQINRLVKAGLADWEDGWERFAIAIFGADRTPIQK